MDQVARWHPSAVEEWISVVTKCRKAKDLGQAKRVHSHLREHALESHRILGNHLVPMLVDCGSLPDAQIVFDRLPHMYRNEYSWSSLISGYIDSGDPHHALQLYHKMQEHVHPSIFTLQTLLKACSRLRMAQSGHNIHADVIKDGLDVDLFIGNTLVDMYCKCDLLAEARHVFDKLRTRDTVSWNVLIAGYAEHGLGEEALSCFDQMQLEGPLDAHNIGQAERVHRDKFRFLALLKACTTLKDVERGWRIHAQIIRMGLEKEDFIGNTLVDMYGKCGVLADARWIFDKLHDRDTVSWNAITAGYEEHGLDQEVLCVFEEMQLNSIAPDDIMYSYSLKACGITKAPERGHLLCAEIVRKGLEKDLFVGSTVVDMYAKCGLVVEAQRFFDWLPVRTIVSWNALIGGYTDLCFVEEVLSCFDQMQPEGVSPDSTSFSCGLKVCSSTGAMDRGQGLHDEIVKRGLEMDLHVGTTLVAMYANLSLLAEARHVFGRLQVRNAVSWAALMSAYTEQGFDEEVLILFKQMQQGGVPTDALAIARSLQACGSIGVLETGRQIHLEARRLSLERDLLVANTLIDMYGKCGSMVEGQEVFNVMTVRDVVTWNSMIKGYGDNGEYKMAVECFESMRKQALKPNAITFTSLLAACSHACLVHKGEEFFKLMIEEYGIEPTLDHLTCMVDLFARGGSVREAEKFAEATKCHLTTDVLRALLTSCKVYGEVESGSRCFNQLIQVNGEDAAAYLMMMDIFSSAGMRTDASRLQELRKDAGAKKIPAIASIEIGAKLHEFIVGHSPSINVSKLIETLVLRMKGEGCFPSLDTIHAHELEPTLQQGPGHNSPL